MSYAPPAESLSEKQFVIIIGSQSLHGKHPDMADDIVRSAEVDLIAKRDASRTEWLNVIGQDSKFHEEFGYYADPVDETTATFPEGWKGRLVNLPAGDTDGVTGLCLDPHDLAIAKYFAGREAVLTGELATRGIVSKDRLLVLLDQTDVSGEMRQRISGHIVKDFPAGAPTSEQNARAGFIIGIERIAPGGGVMRQVGSKRERALSFNASGALLAEGARFNEAISRLSQTTFVPKGIYRFRSHDAANRHAEDCLVRGMGRLAATRLKNG